MSHFQAREDEISGPMSLTRRQELRDKTGSTTGVLLALQPVHRPHQCPFNSKRDTDEMPGVPTCVPRALETDTERP